MLSIMNKRSDSGMLLEKLRENWSEITRIGVEAEERGKRIGLKPSWATEGEADAVSHQYIHHSKRPNKAAS
jgi:hypothetical protein